MLELYEKEVYMELKAFFDECPSAALAFSGGVDSSYLLYAGIQCGADIKAYYVKTAFQPEFELRDAKGLAAYVGARLEIIPFDISNERQTLANTPERCYHCKLKILETLMGRAKADGYKTIIDGTNASDDAADRQGSRALAELSVRSPLRECGLTKDKIRALSKDAGLPTWDKPAYACLATRIPTGTEITPDLLMRVEGAENALSALGFSDFRVRVAGGAAKIQLPEGQIMGLIKKRDTVLESIRPYFTAITLDLDAR